MIKVLKVIEDYDIKFKLYEFKIVIIIMWILIFYILELYFIWKKEKKL